MCGGACTPKMMYDLWHISGWWVYVCYRGFIAIFFPTLEKDATSCAEILQIPPAGSNPFDTKSEDEGEGEAEAEHPLPAQDEEEEEEDAFLDPELAERLPFLKQRTRHAIAVDDKDLDSFDLPPLMADEALRTCECLF